MPRYLDSKADIVFRKIFGEHPHYIKKFLIEDDCPMNGAVIYVTHH